MKNDDGIIFGMILLTLLLVGDIILFFVAGVNGLEWANKKLDDSERKKAMKTTIITGTFFILITVGLIIGFQLAERGVFD